MQIIALVESPDHVCCRYRLRAFADEFARNGHSLELRSLPQTWLGRFCLGTDLGHADAVILQRRLLPGWQRRLLRRSVRRLIFDFDDAVFSRDSYAIRGIASPARQRRFAATMRMCDAVVAGNSFLAERAMDAGFRVSASVIPTCVDASLYPKAQHRSLDGAIRLAWIGSKSTLQGLERIRPTLEAVGRAVTGSRLRMICDSFLQFDALPVEECVWDPATEALSLAGSDVGISWVPDDDWSRGKCGLKILQYMAAGLPVVANSVGVQCTMIENGVTGFLADTPEQWVAAIGRLSSDPDLRRRMGAAARSRVERDFGIATGGNRWCNLLDGLVRAGRAA